MNSYLLYDELFLPIVADGLSTPDAMGQYDFLGFDDSTQYLLFDCELM